MYTPTLNTTTRRLTLSWIGGLTAVLLSSPVLAQPKTGRAGATPASRPAATPRSPETDKPAVALLGKASGQTLVLRWAPASVEAWLDGLRYGYTLRRASAAGLTGQPVWSVARLLTPAPIGLKPQPAFEALASGDKYVLTAMRLLHDTAPPPARSEEAKNETDARFLFSLLCADLSPDAARLSGLGWVDTDVKPGERYRYSVRIAYPTPRPGAEAVVVLDLTTPDRSRPVTLLGLTYLDSVASVRWDAGRAGMYSAFILERSADYGVTYQRQNTEPIMATSEELADNSVATTNRVPSLHRPYYYRVRGITPFGEPGPPTDPQVVYAYQTRIPPPLEPAYVLYKDQIAALSWTYPDSLRLNLKGFKVLKTTDITSPAHLPTHAGLLPPTAKGHLDKLTDLATYYQVVAVDLGGRELRSKPVFIELADTIPPVAPRQVSYEVSKTGVIRLHWNPSPDKDLYGYSVYRSNEGPANYMLRPGGMRTDTVATDTIPLHNTGRFVYYVVVAADNHLNTSRGNDTLAVPRPDIIPPLAPVLQMVSVTDSLVRLDWLPSGSDDVVSYLLERATLPDTTRQPLARFDAAGLLACYEDRAVLEGTAYAYRVVAIDQAGLRSGEEGQVWINVPVPRVRKAIPTFTQHLLDGETGRVALRWTYPAPKPVLHYTLYRSTGEGPLNYYKRLEGADQTTLTEKLVPEQTYRYTLWATLADGSRTEPTAPLLVRVPVPKPKR